MARIRGGIHHCRTPPQRTDIRTADGFAQDAELAGGGMNRPDQAAGEGGFAAAIGSEQGGAAAPIECEINAVEDEGVAADNGDTARLDRGVAGEMRGCASMIVVHEDYDRTAMTKADPTLSDRETKLLLQLTALPTASGRESSVMSFVRDWVQRRRGLKLQRDEAGNLLITRSDCEAAQRPVVFVAHMDHPAFVLRKTIDDTGRRVEAEFRGGVEESYFRGSRVRLWKAGKPGIAGTVVETRFDPAKRYDKTATIELDERAATQPGQIGTWDLPAPRIEDGRLIAPVCDNLAGVASALAALDRVRSGRSHDIDLRVLLTRAEEVGFVGAVSACKHHTLPRASRIVVLENSRAYDESPSGGGTILRVGDRTSTFDADVTRRLGVAAGRLENADPPLKWMRRLMPGGTCEATAFVAFGYRAGCVCLPLLNYHNMDTATGRIASESVAVSDYEATVRLLTEATQQLATGSAPVLRKQLTKLHRDQKWLLDS